MNKYKQQGAVLLIGIILLLVITIIGVSAVSVSNIKTQVAGNTMFTMLTYQGAESALVKSVSGGSEINIKNAAQRGVGTPYSVPNSFFTAPSEVVSGGATLDQQATVTNLGLFPCPMMAVANAMGKCYIFETDARARLISTGANARHIEGRAIPELGIQ